jgi:hypothetical protein
MYRQADVLMLSMGSRNSCLTIRIINGEAKRKFGVSTHGIRLTLRMSVAAPPGEFQFYEILTSCGKKK